MESLGPHYVDVARASSDRGEVVLRQRVEPDAPEGTPVILELRVNGVFVMDDHETGSEEELAHAALALVDEPRRVLVGGLGLGFTTHEVLADHRVEHVCVAEVEDALVRWFRDGTVPHGPAYLADSRLSVAVADVAQIVAEAAPASYDLVLLDVDNGPDFLVLTGNAALYDMPFLEQVRAALRPGGVLAIWSSTEAPTLCETMRRVFGDVEARPWPVLLGEREEEYWLHTARKRPDEQLDAHPDQHDQHGDDQEER